jgi:hypothetical protein
MAIDKAFCLPYGKGIERPAPRPGALAGPRRTGAGKNFPAVKKIFMQYLPVTKITVWQAPCRHSGNVNAGEGR